MFSGIIESVGRVRAVEAAAGGGAARLAIELGALAQGLRTGASVAVNGVCLTLARLADSRAGLGEFDVIPETLRRTNLGDLQPGARVNLERSLRVGDPIDGHFVQGHVEGTGRVARIDRAGGEVRMWIDVAPELEPCLVPKGGVAVDGVSLTLADTAPGRFCVALIPTTLERTVLGQRRPGDRVNIETDILARIVLSRLGAGSAAGSGGGAATAPGGAGGSGGALTFERLREVGFVT